MCVDFPPPGRLNMSEISAGSSTMTFSRLAMNERPLDPSTNMPLSSMLDALAVDGADGWSVHYRALIDRAEGEDVIVLSVGDPDFATPPAITDAAIKALHDEQTHYTLAGGIKPLVEQIAAHESARLGWPVGHRIRWWCVQERTECPLLHDALPCGSGRRSDPPVAALYTMFEGVVGASGGVVKVGASTACRWLPGRSPCSQSRGYAAHQGDPAEFAAQSLRRNLELRCA